jgi:hypothetical protein
MLVWIPVVGCFIVIYYTGSFDIFKSVDCIRQNLAEGRFLAQLSAEEHLELAGHALRAEFGEFIDLIHGGGAYFSLQHYLPEAVRYGVNMEQITKDTKP